jgi:hypothetical protein
VCAAAVEVLYPFVFDHTEAFVEFVEDACAYLLFRHLLARREQAEDPTDDGHARERLE